MNIFEEILNLDKNFCKKYPKLPVDILILIENCYYSGQTNITEESSILDVLQSFINLYDLGPFNIDHFPPDSFIALGHFAFLSCNKNLNIPDQNVLNPKRLLQYRKFIDITLECAPVGVLRTIFANFKQFQNYSDILKIYYELYMNAVHDYFQKAITEDFEPEQMYKVLTLFKEYTDFIPIHLNSKDNVLFLIKLLNTIKDKLQMEIGILTKPESEGKYASHIFDIEQYLLEGMSEKFLTSDNHSLSEVATIDSDDLLELFNLSYADIDIALDIFIQNKEYNFIDYLTFILYPEDFEQDAFSIDEVLESISACLEDPDMVRFVPIAITIFNCIVSHYASIPSVYQKGSDGVAPSSDMIKYYSTYSISDLKNVMVASLEASKTLLSKQSRDSTEFPDR